MEQPTNTLNNLIKVNNERINTYQDATIKLSKPTGKYSDMDLALLNSFACYIDQSMQTKAEVKSLIAELGVQVQDNYQSISTPSETWIKLKELSNNNGLLAILEKCLSTEETTQKAYKKALSDDKLTAYMGETLSKQKKDLQAAYRQIQIEIDELTLKTTR